MKAKSPQESLYESMATLFPQTFGMTPEKPHINLKLSRWPKFPKDNITDKYNIWGSAKVN